MFKPVSQNQQGFTLVELIVTAAYVATASAAIIGIFITIGAINRESRNMSVATALAEQKIETYRNAGYNAVPIGTPAEDFSSKLPTNFGSPKSAVANVTTPSTGLKQVDIVISYTENKRPKKVQMSTLMTQRGINR
jgi:prepilin-type N-terminal cleavage/methylation domain-containing protein